MEKLQEKTELFLLPFNWHNDDEDITDSGDEDDNIDGDVIESNETKAEKTIKSSSKETKKSNTLGEDSDISDDIPENVDNLTAEELRELLRTQGNELKRSRLIARKRLREIMEKKEKFKAIEEEKEKARILELQEKEKYKEIVDDLLPKYETLKKDVVKTHSHFEKRLEKLKDTLPEEYHNLIPDGIDVRFKIAWIENFNNTIVKKQKEVEKAAKEIKPQKKKAETPVGSQGNPPEDTEKTKKGTKESMEAAINNCRTPEELERLLSGLASQGIKNM